MLFKCLPILLRDPDGADEVPVASGVADLRHVRVPGINEHSGVDIDRMRRLLLRGGGWRCFGEGRGWEGGGGEGGRGQWVAKLHPLLMAAQTNDSEMGVSGMIMTS